MDHDGNYIDVSDEYERLRGFKKEEFLKMNFAYVLQNEKDYNYSMGILKQFQKSNVHSNVLTLIDDFSNYIHLNEVVTKYNTFVYTLSFGQILYRRLDGKVNVLLGSMHLEPLAKYIMNSLLRNNIPKSHFDNLSKSVTHVISEIERYRNEKLGKESKIFKIYENMSVGCIICKVQKSDLILIFANKKMLHLRNVYGQSLQVMINQRAWETIKRFVMFRLPFVEVCGQLLGSAMYKLMGHWYGNYVVFYCYSQFVIEN